MKSLELQLIAPLLTTLNMQTHIHLVVDWAANHVPYRRTLLIVIPLYQMFAIYTSKSCTNNKQKANVPKYHLIQLGSAVVYLL